MVISLDDGIADLHLHTTASDGTCDIEDRITQAVDRDLDAIAITDHDVIDDRLTEPVTSVDGVELVTGVEARAEVQDTKVELLGYFIDPTEPELQTVLETARRYRSERNRELVANLTDVTGLNLSYETLREDADGQLGRPHLAAKLLDAGVVSDIGEAFDKFLGPDGEAYVQMERVSAVDIIDAIHDAGGIVSLAHPGRIRTDDTMVTAIVEELVEAGLDAIEVWYPYGSIRSSDYADIGVEEALSLAAEYDLLRTGGSDCHGPGSGKYRIGDVRAPASALKSLRERASE